MPKVHIRRNDTVVVLSGKDRGKRGRVLRVMPDTGRALVEGVNLVKRHTKPNPQRNVKGGIVEREAAVHASKLMLVDPVTDQPTRIGRRILDDGHRVRIGRKSGEVVDR
jgi:large subunit ribosomal protein L24